MDGAGTESVEMHQKDSRQVAVGVSRRGLLRRVLIACMNTA